MRLKSLVHLFILASERGLILFIILIDEFDIFVFVLSEGAVVRRRLHSHVGRVLALFLKWNKLLIDLMIHEVLVRTAVSGLFVIARAEVVLLLVWTVKRIHVSFEAGTNVRRSSVICHLDARLVEHVIA